MRLLVGLALPKVSFCLLSSSSLRRVLAPPQGKFALERLLGGGTGLGSEWAQGGLGGLAMDSRWAWWAFGGLLVGIQDWSVPEKADADEVLTILYSLNGFSLLTTMLDRAT